MINQWPAANRLWISLYKIGYFIWYFQVFACCFNYSGTFFFLIFLIILISDILKHLRKGYTCTLCMYDRMWMFIVVAPVLSYTSEVPNRKRKFFVLYWTGLFHNVNLSYDLLFRRTVKFMTLELIDKLTVPSKLFFLK